MLCRANTTLVAGLSAPGRYEVIARATDRAGNPSNSATLAYEIDGTPPVVSSFDCPPVASETGEGGAALRNGHLACSAEIRDGETLVDHAEVEVDAASNGAPLGCTPSALVAPTAPGDLWSGQVDLSTCPLAGLSEEIEPALTATDVWGNTTTFTGGKETITRVLWRVDPDPKDTVLLSPALASGVVLVTSCDAPQGDPCRLIALDATDGSSVQQIDIPSAALVNESVVAGPAVYDDGSGNYTLRFLRRTASLVFSKRYTLYTVVYSASSSDLTLGTYPTSLEPRKSVLALPAFDGSGMAVTPILTRYVDGTYGLDVAALRPGATHACRTDPLATSLANAASLQAWTVTSSAGLHWLALDNADVHGVTCTCGQGGRCAESLRKTTLAAPPSGDLAEDAQTLLIPSERNNSTVARLYDTQQGTEMNTAVSGGDLRPFVLHDTQRLYMIEGRFSARGTSNILFVSLSDPAGYLGSVPLAGDARALVLGRLSDGTRALVATSEATDGTLTVQEIRLADDGTTQVLWDGQIGTAVHVVASLRDPITPLIKSDGILVVPLGGEIAAIVPESVGPAPGWPMWRGDPARSARR
jgi:hypothetical protein